MEQCECLPLNTKIARKYVLVKKTVQQTKSYSVVQSAVHWHEHVLSLGCHWSVVLLITLCLNSAQTEINCCFRSSTFGWLTGKRIPARQTPDPVVDRFEVWRLQTEFRSSEVWSLRNSFVSCALCAGALSYWKMKKSWLALASHYK